MKARQTEQAYYTRPSPIYNYELATPFIYPYIAISQHFHSSAVLSKEPKKEFCLLNPLFQVKFSSLIIISSEFNTFTSWVFFLNVCACYVCMEFWSCFGVKVKTLIMCLGIQDSWKYDGRSLSFRVLTLVFAVIYGESVQIMMLWSTGMMTGLCF